MKDEVQNVLTDDARKRIHEILGRMRYHPYPVLDPPKPLWPNPTPSICNCPDDDAFREFLKEYSNKRLENNWDDDTIMDFDQFDGFMEKVTENVKPVSILNTLHSLDEQGCNSEHNEIRIKGKDFVTVEYTLIAELDNQDIEITTEPDNCKNVYHNVCYLMVKVKAHTRVEKQEFIVDFENEYYVIEEDDWASTCAWNPGLIKEIRILK